MNIQFVNRGAGLSLLAAMYFAMNVPALAQIVPRPPLGLPVTPIGSLPYPPRITASPTGTGRAEFSSPQTTTLRWSQLVTTSQGQVDPSYFVICIQDPALACTWQAHQPTNGVWSGAATGSLFTRTANYTSSPFSQVRFLDSYSYSMAISLPNTFFDRALKWTVGACTGTTTSSCTFSTPAQAWYSTKNIFPDGFNFSFFYKDRHWVDVNALAANDGSTDVGPFTSEAVGMEALIDATNNGICETNPNRAGLNLSDSALLITNDGQMISVGTRRSGGVISTQGITVVGISRLGPQLLDGPPESQDRYLSPNDTQVRVSTHRIRVLSNISPFPAAGTRFAIAGVSRTDSAGLSAWTDAALNNRIVEFNELDNGRGRCTVMIW